MSVPLGWSYARVNICNFLIATVSPKRQCKYASSFEMWDSETWKSPQMCSVAPVQTLRSARTHMYITQYAHYACVNNHRQEPSESITTQKLKHGDGCVSCNCQTVKNSHQCLRHKILSVGFCGQQTQICFVSWNGGTIMLRPYVKAACSGGRWMQHQFCHLMLGTWEKTKKYRKRW